MTGEFRRLGKPGAYRLGYLRARGIQLAEPPAPFRPSFARNPRRGPAAAWLVALIALVLAIAGGAALGWWFLPFAAGLAAGLANRIAGWPARIALPAVVVMALLGWGIPLAWQIARGQPYRSAAHLVGGAVGIPASATTGLGLTLLIAVGQACLGYWLGRALTPRPDHG